MQLSAKKEKEFLEKIKKIKELEKQKKSAEKNIDQLKGELKDYMTKKNVSELEVDVFTVHYTDCSSERFDTDSFKKTHEELYRQYLKTSSTKRFSIT